MQNESRTLLTSLYHAAVEGASPVEKTRVAVTAAERSDEGEADVLIRGASEGGEQLWQFERSTVLGGGGEFK